MIENTLLNLERELIREEVRSSAEKISEILADRCLEFCSSGDVYRYKAGDIFPLGREADWEIVDFDVKELAADVMHTTFRLLRHDEADHNKRISLRSSIWKLENEKWKMIFHQGTPTKQ